MSIELNRFSLQVFGHYGMIYGISVKKCKQIYKLF